MDSPRAPEASSPVVMGFQSAHFTLPSMVDMSTNSTSTSTRTNRRTRTRSAIVARSSSIIRDVDLPIPTIYSRARQAAARPLPVSSVGTNIAPTTFARGRVGAAATSIAVAGPTTRSRKRKTNTSISTSTSTTPLAAAAAAASATSSTRRPPALTSPTSTSASKRSRAKKARVADTRKKPPPGLKKAPPVTAAAASLKSGGDDDKKPAPAEAAAAVDNCCICMCDVEPNDLASINSCSHQFCFGCIDKWAERENKCPLCKLRFTKIDRVNKKRKKGTKNTKKVKNRDQHSLVPGAALEGLIANLQSGSLARIIFGGFDFGGANIGGPGGTTARASFAARGGRGGPPVGFGSFDDSDEEDSPMAHFMRAIHGGPGANGVRLSTTVVRPVSVTARFTTTTTSRSFARNAHDSTAGNNSQNPLEIDDDDEVIEID